MWNKIKTVLSDIACIALLIMCALYVYIGVPIIFVCAIIGITMLPLWQILICGTLLIITLIMYVGLIACFWISGKESEYEGKDN